MLQPFYSAPSLAALKTLSFANYRAILDYPGIGSIVWNSIFLAVVAATLVVLITAVISWLVVRTKMPGRWLLDNMATLPMVMPGIVTGVAIMVTYLAFGGGIYALGEGGTASVQMSNTLVANSLQALDDFQSSALAGGR